MILLTVILDVLLLHNLFLSVTCTVWLILA